MKSSRMSQILSTFCSSFHTKYSFYHNFNFVFLFASHAMIDASVVASVYSSFICPPYSRGQAWASAPSSVSTWCNSRWVLTFFLPWIYDFIVAVLLNLWGETCDSFICLMAFIERSVLSGILQTHLTNNVLLTIICMLMWTECLPGVKISLFPPEIKNWLMVL